MKKLLILITLILIGQFVISKTNMHLMHGGIDNIYQVSKVEKNLENINSEIGGLSSIDISVPLDSASSESQSIFEILPVENMEFGEIINYPIAFLSGSIEGIEEGELRVLSADQPYTYPVYKDKFKALVRLTPGLNRIEFSANDINYFYELRFEPIENPSKYVKIFWYIGSDGDGSMDAPPNVPNDFSEVEKRLQLNALMLQTFFAETYKRARHELYPDSCFSRETFHFEYDSTFNPVVTVFRHPTLTQQELWNRNDGGADWSEFVYYINNQYEFLPVEERWNPGNVVHFVRSGVSHLDPETGIYQAGVCLGGGGITGGGVGMCHGGNLITHPPNLEEVPFYFTNNEQIELDYIVQDDAGRGARYWTSYATTLGAWLHECGHAFSLPHTNTGIMSRDFDFINRFFMVYEEDYETKIAVNLNNEIPVYSTPQPWWHPSSVSILGNNPFIYSNNDLDSDGIADLCDDDKDGDGFSTEEDCDDWNININPSASEVPNNSKDENCDGIALGADIDGDGFAKEEDCDDFNSAIYPGAIEIPNNDIDEDCDGEDQKTTSTNDSQAKIYWAEVESGGMPKIQRADLNGMNVEDFITTDDGVIDPKRLVVDEAAKKIYWTDAGTNKIHRSDLDGTNIEDLVSDLWYPDGIALDVEGGKMYWTDWLARKIQRADLDGTNIQDLITTDIIRPTDLVLDLAAGNMYWPDNGTRKVQRADLDGTNVEDLVSGLRNPIGIDIDVESGKLYWTDWGSGKIQRADLNGSNVEDLVTGLSYPSDLALDIIEGKMYWTDWGIDKIQRADLNGSNIEDIVTGLISPYGIEIYTPVESTPTDTRAGCYYDEDINYEVFNDYVPYIISGPKVSAWYGKRVVLIIDGDTIPENRDFPTMEKIISSFDAIVEKFVEITGRIPPNNNSLKGRIRIEFNIDREGYGAGGAHHGVYGIHATRYFFEDLYERVLNGQNSYDQVFFYELTRNYWFEDLTNSIDYFTDDGDYGYWVVGFNNAMAIFLPDEIDGIDDLFYFGMNGEEFKALLTANFKFYLENPEDWNFDNTWKSTLIPWSETPQTLNDIMTGLLVYLYDNYGGIQFIKDLYRQIPLRYSLESKNDHQGARDNFYVAASLAANKDLFKFFNDTMRWEISENAQLDVLQRLIEPEFETYFQEYFAYEPFEYQEFHELFINNSGLGWFSPWIKDTINGQITILDGSLSYNDLVTNGNRLLLSPNTDEPRYTFQRYLESKYGCLNTSIWLSFLIKADTIRDGGVEVIPGTSLYHTLGKIWGKKLGIYTTDSEVEFNEGQTYFIVSKLELNEGNDIMYLWINPDLDTHPNTNDANIVYEERDAGEVNKLQFRVQGWGQGDYQIDEFRIGSTFREVAPTNENIITSQPQSVEVCPPESVQLDISVEGENVQYHWFKNGIPLYDKTKNYLNFDSTAQDIAGDYFCYITSPSGNLISDTVHINVIPPDSTNISAEICNGDTYIFEEDELFRAGQYEYYYTNQFGCDSTVILDLTVNYYSETILEEVICAGETFEINGTSYGDAGIYSQFLTNSKGCDSVIVLSLEVDDVVYTNQEVFICENETYEMGDSILSESGQYEFTLQTKNGCDSVVTIDLKVLKNSVTQIDEAVCVGDVYSLNGSNYNQEGIYTQLLSTVNGCDSLLILNLEVYPEQDPVPYPIDICEGDTFSIQGESFFAEGNYDLITGLNQQGCDSITQFQVALFEIPDLGLPDSLELSLSDTLNLEVEDVYMNYLWTFGNTGYLDSVNYKIVLETQVLGLGDHLITLEVQDINGCFTQDTVIVSVNETTSISTNEFAENFITYPNPFHTFIFIDNQFGEELNYELISIEGKTIRAGILNKGQSELNTSHILPGVYILVVKGDQFVTNRKLVRME